MATEAWSEIELAKKENRRELVLSGKKNAEDGLDENLFELKQLNFLDISKINLSFLSNKIEQLNNLTNLVLSHNKLELLPDSVGKLEKLKMLDISSNKLSKLPEELSKLKELHTINVNCNNLEDFFSVGELVNLHVLDISHNKLSQLPDGIDSSNLSSLLDIIANDNQINTVPDDLCDLATLKHLDLSNNKLEQLPSKLSECGKLKEFKCIGNKLKDRRLLKLVEQCSTKQVLDYLKQQLKKEPPKPKKEDTKKKSKGGKEKQEKEKIPLDVVKVCHFDVENGLLVKVMGEVANVRPYIVCCIVRNVNFNKSQGFMRRFLSLQTRLHEDLCVKRQLATIATHDLEKLQGPLIYDAKEPKTIQIQPLNKLRPMTADVLVVRLRREAEELRKEKKRHTISGVHKYLNLLKDKPLYPCLLDNQQHVISFPPIINSNVTKIYSGTRHMLLEVTGSHSLDTCKKVMDELLLGILKMNLGQEKEPEIIVKQEDSVAKSEESTNEKKKSESKEEKKEGDGLEEDVGRILIDEEEGQAKEAEETEGGAKGEKVLVVEQVKVVDDLNNLKVLYPSKTDLNHPSKCKVIKN